MEVLTQKQYKTYSYLSRYSPFPIWYNNVDDKYVYSTTRQLNKNTPYIVHVTDDDLTLNELALYYYNNPTLYWVIADFNSIQDPFTIIKAGQKINIPTLSNISYV